LASGAHVHRGEQGCEPLSRWPIRVWEAQPPAHVKKPQEWILLTDEPIPIGIAARERVSVYERRPPVEDDHKGQSTGVSIEQLQVQSTGIFIPRSPEARKQRQSHPPSRVRLLLCQT